MDRVQRVFLATGRCCDRAFLVAEHPDLVVALVEDAASTAMLGPFPLYGDAPPAAGGAASTWWTRSATS